MGKINRKLKKTVRSGTGYVKKDLNWLNKKGKSIVHSAFNAKGKKAKKR